MRTEISKLTAGSTVQIQGFVDKIRDQKSIQFIIIRDRSGKVQVTVFKPELPEIAKVFEGLTVESVVRIEGKVVAAPNVKLGGIELIPSSVDIVSTSKLLPLDGESGIELQMDYRWIDLRDPKKLAWFKVQTIGEKAMRDWLIDNDFIEVHSPKITAFASEGGSEVFEVKYYDRKAYLTQSPQLFKQMAMSAGFERFFEIGPQYRAEKSYTSRHASESFALDMEIAHIESHHEVMDALEGVLKYTLNEIEKKCGDMMRDVLGMEFKAQTVKFPRISLLDAYTLLEKEKGYKVPRAAKGDLDPESERLLCEIAKEKYDSDFIYITDFPAACRAFYSMKHDDDNKLTKSFDLLYKGVEITSGAQREHRVEKLKQNMLEKGIDPKTMDFYIQFFEYGVPTHGGIGFGLARFFSRLLDLPSIKDVIFLFRGPDRLAP
jgi:aspartyl-tRNA synthetase